jgi:hypothetical protein
MRTSIIFDVPQKPTIFVNANQSDFRRSRSRPIFECFRSPHVVCTVAGYLYMCCVQLQGTCGVYSCSVPIAMVYSCRIPAVFTVAVYLWCIVAGYLWCVQLQCTCGITVCMYSYKLQRTYIYLQCVQLQCTCSVYNCSVPAMCIVTAYLQCLQLQCTCGGCSCRVPVTCISAAYLRCV